MLPAIRRIGRWAEHPGVVPAHDGAWNGSLTEATTPLVRAVSLDGACKEDHCGYRSKGRGIDARRQRCLGAQAVTTLRAIQTKFIESIDGFDPDFRDFQEAAKMERLILGDPTERREDVKTSRLIVELGESELLEAARAIASKRYGLPTNQEIVAIQRRAAIQSREECDRGEGV